MDSGGKETSGETKKREINVYVTGFGPFNKIHTNPSSEVLHSLPPTITFTSSTTNTHYTVNLIPHPSLKVSYTTVSTLIPTIYAENDFDYMLHVGVGLDGRYYLERKAHEKGYNRRDVDGLTPGGDEGCVFSGVHGSEANRKEPEDPGRVYRTGLDIGWICSQDSTLVSPHTNPPSPVLISSSNNAGRYLCEYIYHTSLRCRLLKDSKTALDSDGMPTTDSVSKRVLFLHVPPKGKPYGIEVGTKVVCGVIEGMVRDGEGDR
ncbi:hypothetical protein RUND412_011277 [Rhizina undulata]